MAALDHSAMRLVELYRALMAMGPDADRIGRLDLRTISGDRVGELLLSTQDVERLLQLLKLAANNDAIQLVADVEAFLADEGAA